MQTGGTGSFGSTEGIFSEERGLDISKPGSVWDWWRSQMPIHRQWTYLDHAAVAPLSQPAGDAIRKLATQAETLGDTVWPQWAANISRMRTQFSEMLGADEDDLFVVPNTSTGISLVAEGFPWKNGDNVVVPEGEFPSNLFPWLNQQHRGVNVRIVPRRGSVVAVEDLISHVDERTRLIAASWVGYSSGYRIEIADLVQRAHEKGVLVFLDAIQGLGVHPLDLKKIPVDFLAADGHKWLLGPEGVGIAMIRREHRENMRCPIVGWNSVRNAHQFSHAAFELRDDAARYEAGSANMLGIAGLSASVELFLQVLRTVGPKGIEERVLELSSHLSQELVQLGATVERDPSRQHQSGIVSFNIPGHEPGAIRERALANRIVLSCRGGGVRASVHAYNNFDDIERLVVTLRELIAA